MAGVIQSCPYCGEQMGAHAVFHSGLGPSAVICDITCQAINTGRQEWAEMGVFRRGWYCLFSVLYAALIGLWGGVMASAIANPSLAAKPEKPVEVAPLEVRLLLVGCFSLFFVMGLWIQFARVQGSLKRTSAGTILTHRDSAKYFYGQITTIALMLVIGVLVVFLSTAIHSQAR